MLKKTCKLYFSQSSGKSPLELILIWFHSAISNFHSMGCLKTFFFTDDPDLVTLCGEDDWECLVSLETFCIFHRAAEMILILLRSATSNFYSRRFGAN